MLRKSMLAMAMLGLIAVPAAWAAGLFPGFPIVGGASYCGSTNNGNCTVTVPAGPTGVTGSETVPADTNLASGQAPQTVIIGTPLLASGGFKYIEPLAAASFTIPDGVTNYVMNPAGTLATLTLTMPANPKEGQIVRISSSKTVTALTLNGNTGQTISNAPTAITISTTGTYGYEFLYRSTVWYRVN